MAIDNSFWMLQPATVSNYKMTTALFSDIERTLLAKINKTARDIKIAVAWFTNPHLFSSLLNLLDIGKSIEIILADEAINFSNKKIDFQQLIDKGVEIRISRFPSLMHNKFCIINERLLITGSYNWTKSAEVNNHENVILSTELKLVSQFNSQFNELKKNTERLVYITSTKFNNYISKIEVQEEMKLITDTALSSYEATDNIEKKSGMMKLVQTLRKYWMTHIYFTCKENIRMQ